MQIDSVIGLAAFFTSFTVLGTLCILVSNLLIAERKKFRAWLLAVYLILALIILLAAL